MTRSLRSSPSTTDISDYDCDYRTPVVTPNGVNVSIEQQQEDASNFLQIQHVQGARLILCYQYHGRLMEHMFYLAPLNLIWDNTPQAFSDAAPEYERQQQEPCPSMLGLPFHQELVDSEPQLQRLTYAVSTIDISNGYDDSFTASEYDIHVGTYPAHQPPYENTIPLADVDLSLYAYSPETFTILDAVPNDSYFNAHLSQPRL